MNSREHRENVPTIPACVAVLHDRGTPATRRQFSSSDNGLPNTRRSLVSSTGWFPQRTNRTITQTTGPSASATRWRRIISGWRSALPMSRPSSRKSRPACSISASSGCRVDSERPRPRARVDAACGPRYARRDGDPRLHPRDRSRGGPRAGAQARRTFRRRVQSRHRQRFVREILAAIAAETGREVPHVVKPRRSGDPTYLVADPSAARATLNFRPAHSDLATIIRTAWAWHKKAHPLKTGVPVRDQS